MPPPSDDELAAFDTRQRADIEEVADDITSARYRAAVAMREWAAVPYDDGVGRWAALAVEAHGFVGEHAP